MRQVKFNFWDNEEEVMIGWHVACQTAFNQTSEYSGRGLMYDLMTDATGRYVKLQFTGLKDKNGKEIYEDDIVGDAAGRRFVVDYMECEASFIFKWSNNRKAYLNYSQFSDCHQPIEWVGNIHENLELLEAKNDD